MIARSSFWALFAVGAIADAAHEKVTPVEKVIEMMKKLESDVVAEGKNEAKEYDKFACFCKEQASDKLYAIEKSRVKITELESKIEELETEISDLDGEIQELGERITEIEGKVKETTELRDKDRADFQEEQEDLKGAIKAMKFAIKALKDSKKKLKGDAKADLLQKIRPLAADLLGAVQRSRRGHTSDAQLHFVLALAQEAQEAVPKSGKSHDYEYRSNDIIATLEGMAKEFKMNLKELEEEEFHAQSDFEKKILNLKNETKFKTKEKEEKETLVEELSEALHTAEEEKDDETEAKDGDNAFMEELTNQCEEKATQWDQRSKTRAEELTALNEAITAVEGGAKDNYNSNKKLVGLAAKSVKVTKLKLKSPASFLQLQNENLQQATVTRVIEMLDKQAGRLRSKTLSGLVAKASLEADHFVKVRGLINDLIDKLEADAEAEAEQKSFCDIEMKKAIGTRDEQSIEIEKETATITAKGAEKKELEDEIRELAKELAELRKALKEATELRATERAANEKALSMAREGHEAVEMALQVLNEFYNNAFLQTAYVPPSSDRDGNTVGDLAPKTSFDSDYQGNQGASKGIVGMLEVIITDFERTIDTVGDQEEHDEGEFEDFEKDSNDSIEAKEDEKTANEEDVAACEEAITDAKDKLIDANDLRDAANKELSKLKPMCVEGEETYAQTREARAQEIEALKEALKVLQDM